MRIQSIGTNLSQQTGSINNKRENKPTFTAQSQLINPKNMDNELLKRILSSNTMNEFKSVFNKVKIKVGHSKPEGNSTLHKASLKMKLDGKCHIMSALGQTKESAEKLLLSDFLLYTKPEEIKTLINGQNWFGRLVNRYKYIKNG